MSGIILFLMLRAVVVCVGVLSEVCASIQRQLLAALGVHFTIPHGTICQSFFRVYYYNYGAGTMRSYSIEVTRDARCFGSTSIAEWQ